MNSQIIQWEHLSIPIIRSNRKTIGVYIKKAQVTVRAPKLISRGLVICFLNEKRDWIHQKLILHKKNLVSPRHFKNGELFLYLGRHYQLLIQTSFLNQAVFKQGKLVIQIQAVEDKTLISKLIQDYYKQLAIQFLIKRVRFYALDIGALPSEVCIRSFKSIWGNCNRFGKVQLNWKIIMAPRFVCDYVVVHEMAHLIHLNHGKLFWNLVQQVLPDYQSARRWLKEKGHWLTI